MGLLIDGEWHDKWYDTKESGGRFIREDAQFRNWITPDGRAGATGEAGFKAEAGRYHLFASYACPWVHRVLLFRKLKGLEDFIDVSFVHWLMADKGWTFEKDPDGIVGDTLFGFDFAHQIYTKADPTYTGRVTVPILWDTKTNTIVSNESSEIIRMLNSAFDGITGNTADYWPASLREAIAPVNDRIYDTLNNGVYKCGFATTQAAYDSAITPLFDTLDWLEERLGQSRYLMGEDVTEADWGLFTTLIRFDPVYHLHFKCNRRRIVDYPNLWGYVRELYQWPGVAATVNMAHIVRHYHYSHDSINPHRIIPINPELDYDAPHDRDQMLDR